MSATFDPNLLTALDRMRSQLGDTEVTPESAALLPDESYTAALARYGETGGTAFLAQSLATRFAREPGSVHLPSGLSVSWPDRVQAWTALAVSLRAGFGGQHIPAVGRLTTVAPISAPTGFLDGNDLRYSGGR